MSPHRRLQFGGFLMVIATLAFFVFLCGAFVISNENADTIAIGALAVMFLASVAGAWALNF